VSPPGDSNRLFIVEQIGRIQVITNLNSPNTTLFLDISDRVASPWGEGGLLGLAFHPGYPTNRSFFLSTREHQHRGGRRVFRSPRALRDLANRPEHGLA